MIAASIVKNGRGLTQSGRGHNIASSYAFISAILLVAYEYQVLVLEYI